MSEETSRLYFFQWERNHLENDDPAGSHFHLCIRERRAQRLPCAFGPRVDVVARRSARGVDRTLWRDEAHAARLRSAIEHSRADNTIVEALDWAEQDVIASDGAIDDRFGTSVAVSGDTAVVGAADVKIGDNYYQGAAYVFARQDGVWTETQKLTASDGAGMADFGTAVAIAGDTILISAIGANVGGNSNQGAVYVFGQSGGVWTQTQKLAADDGGSGDAFGNTITVNGSTAFIAAKGATINGNTLQGKVYVFTEAGGAWTQSQALTADDGASNDRSAHRSRSMATSRSSVHRRSPITFCTPAGRMYSRIQAVPGRKGRRSFRTTVRLAINLAPPSGSRATRR